MITFFVVMHVIYGWASLGMAASLQTTGLHPNFSRSSPFANHPKTDISSAEAPMAAMLDIPERQLMDWNLGKLTFLATHGHVSYQGFYSETCLSGHDPIPAVQVPVWMAR